MWPSGCNILKQTQNIFFLNRRNKVNVLQELFSNVTKTLNYWFPHLNQMVLYIKYFQLSNASLCPSSPFDLKEFYVGGNPIKCAFLCLFCLPLARITMWVFSTGCQGNHTGSRGMGLTSSVSTCIQHSCFGEILLIGTKPLSGPGLFSWRCSSLLFLISQRLALSRSIQKTSLNRQNIQQLVGMRLGDSKHLEEGGGSFQKWAKPVFFGNIPSHMNLTQRYYYQWSHGVILVVAMQDYAHLK